MTALLMVVMVVALGTWIPLAQLAPDTPERSRVFYAAIGNVVFTGLARLIGGGRLDLGWRSFWLPLAGGVVWAAGNYCVLKASRTIGLARAAGTWTPLNIVSAFVWGALLFGELDGFSALSFTVLGVAFVAIVVGVLLIARSQQETAVVSTSGFLWAGAAGVLWGSYFIPAQWAGVPAQVGDFPLALGILVGALALALPAREPIRLGVRPLSLQLGAGVLFGIGNLALLAVVSRVGTGTGFTIAQLSLAINTGIGIWVFHVPEPGSRQARKVLTGIAIAGIGGCVLAAMR
jgi:glucose uptake protein GlcU